MSATDASGDQIRALYVDHHGWLHDWLRRRLDGAPDAADIAQDAFLRLLVKLPAKGFSTPLEARAYLRTMAQGMCTDLWRRRQVEQAWLDALATLPEPCTPSPEYTAIIIETLMEIGRLLGKLSEKARTAFVMAQIHGMSTAEIAAELGMSIRSVQKYIEQAMLQIVLAEAGLKR